MCIAGVGKVYQQRQQTVPRRRRRRHTLVRHHQRSLLLHSFQGFIIAPLMMRHKKCNHNRWTPRLASIAVVSKGERDAMEQSRGCLTAASLPARASLAFPVFSTYQWISTPPFPCKAVLTKYKATGKMPRISLPAVSRTSTVKYVKCCKGKQAPRSYKLYATHSDMVYKTWQRFKMSSIASYTRVFLV